MEEGAVPQGAGMPVPRGDPKLFELEAVEGTGQVEEVKTVTSRQRANQLGDHGALTFPIRPRQDDDAEGNSEPVCQSRTPLLAPAVSELFRIRVFGYQESSRHQASRLDR